ncbi:MAG: AAA family ATPase [Ktedonobacteraceae bacterium]|nr:AAA family ATPase [Ktedonobacteraceae bacterium]
MSQPLLIIITGHPATGKTVLGRHIAATLRLPYIYKDGIKERLFDALGSGDRAWSHRLSLATYPLLFYFIEELLKAGYSLIAESNFPHDQGTREFLHLKQRYDFAPFQIHCVADGNVLLQRLKRRWEAGERHVGHQDPLLYDEIAPRLLAGPEPPLAIGGALYELDTTDFSHVDYQRVMAAIREFSHGM